MVLALRDIILFSRFHTIPLRPNMINELIGILIAILLYFLVSLLGLFIGRKVLDWITPYDLNYQTSEVKNLAVGLTQAGFYLAIAIIVHASVSGEVNYELFMFIDPENPSRFSVLMAEIITTAVYMLIGLVLLSYGRRALDWLTPFDLNKQIEEDRNVGVGILEGAFYVSVAIMIHGIIA